MSDASLLHDAGSIGRVAAAYRAGELSPVEVTRACLDRVAARDHELEAFATVTAERALARARRAAAQVRGDRDLHRPLLGIPVGVKDNIDVAGVTASAGSAALAGRAPSTSATVWRRLDAAGAVLIGKTRTHELAYGVTTPPARNPWDTSRAPGGSSGGSAVALAAGMCLGAVGTDTAGSVRIPAGLCGVVGLKPTRGLCPTDGVLPLSTTLDHVGPMATTPGDVGLMLAAMSGDAIHADVADLRGLRVGVARTDALMTPEVAAALERSITAFRDAGGVVEDAAAPSFEAALRHADDLIAVEAAATHAGLLAAHGDRLWPQTRHKLRVGARSHDARGGSAPEDLVAGRRIDAAAYERARSHMSVVHGGFMQVLGAHDVLLAPGVACQAPPFGARAVTVAGRRLSLGRALCWNMAAMNMAGLPAVALPAGAPAGLPVGVQLIGRTGDDGRLLAIASALLGRDGRLADS